MVAGLRALGAVIDDCDPKCWKITGITHFPDEAVIDCGLAGTVMRFLPGVASLSAGMTTFFGDEAASHRPMEPLVSGLRQLGAQVSGISLPIQVSGPLTGSVAVIDSSSSSQFISALLLVGPRLANGLTITHTGTATVPSQPHIDMTLAGLADRGVSVFQRGSIWEVLPGPIAARDEVIEPDLTTAAVFLGAALVCGGQVSIAAWPTQSTQPGWRILGILEQMGAVVELTDSGVTVTGQGEIRGIDIDLRETSELTPVVAAVAALASTESHLRGISHIRGHETDRLAALSAEISGLGGECRQTEDGLVIIPRPLSPGVFHTYADHRMAHAGALIGLRVNGICLDDVGCTSKTTPDFPETWEAMAA